MSAVHEAIAEQAVLTLPPRELERLAPYIQAIRYAATYPDIFNDGMSAKVKAEIDPEADRLLWPPPPHTADYQHVLEVTEKESQFGVAPLRWFYLIEHYLDAVLEAMHHEDWRGAAKLAAVYSHVIGDTGEPIHAVSPKIVDQVLEPPREMLGFELHTGVENLRAPVDIHGYKPAVLGRSRGEAIMQCYRWLVECKRVGQWQVLPIVQALYAGRRDEAMKLSQVAQNEAARCFADFLHTLFYLHEHRAPSAAPGPIDLCKYPYAACLSDMLYRYRPMVDISLIPYSNGQFKPLALGTPDRIEPVHGLGVLPFQGPPFVPETVRETWVEYLLVPGAYGEFTARVGANPHFANRACAAIFTVIADERPLYQSPALDAATGPVQVRVPLGQTRWLKLHMRYVRNPSREDTLGVPNVGWALHGVWAEPQLR